MSVSHNASIFMDVLLLLSIYLNPMSSILFSLLAVPVLPFQHPGTNGIGKHGGRQRYSGMKSMGWASTSQSISSAYRIPRKTFLGLSADPRISDSQVTQQQPSPGMAVNNRDMASLSEWSRGREIVLTDGIELTEDLLGDWSLTATKSIRQGSSIMTVPAEVILTSDITGDSLSSCYTEEDMQNIRDWMKSELESGSQAKQDYLPEYMLVYKLLREVHMGTNSRWYSWLQSLPTQFSTGLYLDEVERNHVERMTGEHIKVQGAQYGACLELFQKFISSQKFKGSESMIPNNFLEWMLSLQQDSSGADTTFDSLVKWAYSIVFTRSWRSPDRKQAQIVPLGDLANHDSQFANLKPGFREKDGAFQFFVTSDIDVVGSVSPKLYLSYGLTYAPARFLVIFGFCDVTAAYIDANLDFLPSDDEKWPTWLEPSQLVASTLNGALSEDVWIAFLYKFLEQSDPDVLSRIRNAFDDSEERGDKFVEEVLEEWEFEVGMEIQAYYQRLLETDFMPIMVTEKDLAEHPNLSMIVNYNLFIRETFLNVLEHVNTFLTQCSQFKQLTASGVENGLGTTTPKSDGSSILHFQSNLAEQTNQTSISAKNIAPKNDTSSKNSESKSFQSVSGQFASSKSSYKNSTDTKPNLPSETVHVPSTNTSMQTSEESSKSETLEGNSSQSLSGQTPIDKYSTGEKRDINLPSKTSKSTTAYEQRAQENLSSEYLNQQSNTDKDSQERINWNNSTNMNDSKTDPFSRYDMSQEGSNLNATSRFSSESFSLQSYSYENPPSYGSSSNSINDQVSQEIPTGNIPTGDFNPEFYAASLKGTTQQNNDFSATPTTSYGNVESQSYSDGNSYPESNAFGQMSQLDPTSRTTQEGSGDTPAFPYGDTEPQTYSLDQEPVQEQIDPTATTTPPFDYGNPNSQSYPKFDTEPTQEMVDYTEAPVFSDVDIGFQPDTDIGFRPDTDTDFSPHSNYESSNAQPYFNGETNGRADSTITPAFPTNSNTGFGPFSDGQTRIPTQERIDSYNIPNGFSDNANTDPQFYPVNQQQPEQQQKVGKEFVTSYTQSLVSDQRGSSSDQQQQQEQQQEQQKQSGGGTVSSKQNNRDVPSTPTTYAEYVQQRQQEGQSGDGI